MPALDSTSQHRIRFGPPPTSGDSHIFEPAFRRNDLEPKANPLEASALIFARAPHTIVRSLLEEGACHRECRPVQLFRDSTEGRSTG